MNKIEKKSGGSLPLFRIAVIGLSVFFAVNLIILAAKIAGQQTIYQYEYSDMQWAMEDGDYPELVSMVARNRALNVQTSEDTSEFAAIADYYQVASMYHAYTVEGDEEKAAAEMEKLKSAEEDIQSQTFQTAKEQIRQTFQIED